MSSLRPDSKITEVTVFESSAQIRRVATIASMPKGEVNVIFSDLPQDLDRENVQVAVRFEKQTDAAGEKEQPTCSLRGVSFKTESAVKEVSDEKKSEKEKIETRIKDLQIQIQDTEDELADAKSQGAFFKGCANSALNGTRPEEDNAKIFSEPENWKKMLDTVADQDASSLSQQRTLERKLKGIREQLQIARNELSAIGGAAVTQHNVVVITLVASRPLTDVDVRISYVVNAAKWTAEYDVRYDPEKNEAKVTYNAVVSQWGTEIWKDVILTISTARPTISGRPKDLTPWHAKIYVPVRSYSRNRKSARRTQEVLLDNCCEKKMAAEECEDLDEQECLSEALEERNLQQFVEARVETAKVKAGATSMSFHIDAHPYTVLNNNKEVRVTLAIVPVKSTVTYLTRPKLTETVFARMKAVNLSDFTLLPGPALVFCGQTFISKTTLERCGPSDDFSVNLGADNDIKVKYQVIKSERSDISAMFSSDKVKHDRLVTIKLHNRKAVPIELTLEDQVPISQHSDITVTMVRPEINENTQDAKAKDNLKQGKVVFELKLAAKEERNVPIQFHVHHPKGFDMDGL